MARTERARYTFVVKEFGDGTPWITMESAEEAHLGVLQRGVFGFHLRPDVDVQQAEQIVRDLNDKIELLSFTDLSGLPHAPDDL